VKNDIIYNCRNKTSVYHLIYRVLDMHRSLIAIDWTKINIGIFELNKLTLLCCSLG